jgi:FAD/FMN-containing dehydrogenase
MPDNNSKKARVIVKQNRTWKNKNLNVEQRVEKLYDVWNPPKEAGGQLTRLKLTVKALSKLIVDSKKANTTLRAYGGAWSLSRVAVSQGGMINTKPLNYIFPLSRKSVSTKYSGDYTKLFFVQCGASVQEVNRYLQKKNLSLKNTGASNGQTIVGAISTGTHGAGINVGSMQEYVVAMHIIVGPNKHILLERKTYPVVTPGLANKLGSELISDDDLFYSALISFGSFGIIHALILETEPIYLLELRRKRLPVNNNLKHAINTLDFSNISLPYDKRPYHFEAVINPHDVSGGAYVTVMYKRPYKQNYKKVVPRFDGLGPGDDVLAVVGTLTDLIPELIPAAVNALVGQFYEEDIEEWGTIGEIFRATNVRGKATSMEIGLPIAKASKALETILAVHNLIGPVACIIALRFVKGSKALLAFTKYDPSCTIEIQAAYSKRSANFFKQVWDELDKENIPYTFHWGQVNNLNAKRVRKMYGDDIVNKWLSARKTLLTEPVRKVFNNPFLKRCGLDG